MGHFYIYCFKFTLVLVTLLLLNKGFDPSKEFSNKSVVDTLRGTSRYVIYGTGARTCFKFKQILFYQRLQYLPSPSRLLVQKYVDIPS
jgi:hypothetical protein